MGTIGDPYNPDFEDGNACPDCSTVIFDGNTPKYVQANFDGILVCPPLPPFDIETNFFLKQSVGGPCFWHVLARFNGILWECTYWCHSIFPAKRSVLELQRNGILVFYSESADSCITNFPNQNDCSHPEIGIEGTGGITWGPDINQTAYDAQNLA